MYEKQTWKTGDVITEEKLNHMEEGIGSCVFPVEVEEIDAGYSLKKTWKEIFDAAKAGKTINCYEVYDTGVYHYFFEKVARSNSNNYYCYLKKDNERMLFQTGNENGYPFYDGLN